MTIQIDNGTKNPGRVLKPNGDYVIVLAFPVSLPSLDKWLIQQGIVTSAILIIHPQPIQGKTAKLQDLKKGWLRVQVELSVFAPQVKRVLLMGGSSGVKVAANVNKADIRKWHGTIMSASVTTAQSPYYVENAHYEIIPTFEFKYWDKAEYQPWMKRDVARLLRLKKPDAPLSFNDGIPQWLKENNSWDGLVI